MTPDPLGGDITNPQSLNRYAYALNNPTTLTDPLGLDTCQTDSGPVPCPNVIGTSVTVTASGCDPSDLQCEACYQLQVCIPPASPTCNYYTGVGCGPGESGGGGSVAPPPKPAPKPKPGVPLNAFATAVFHRVYCGTQFLDRLPSIKGGGLFGFGGLEFQVPIVPVKGEALGIVNYDARAGFSTGALVGASSSNTIGPGGAVERTYNWSTGKWETEGLGFFGAETEGLNIGAVGGGLLFGTQGAVGFYGQVGSFGGGGYLNVSYGACQ